METYSEIHRILLTHLQASQCLSRKQLLSDFEFIIRRLLPEQLSTNSEETAQFLETCISDVNRQITQHGFKIDKKSHELTGELYYIYINQYVDEMIKNITTYSTSELDVIRQLIDEIINSQKYSYSLSKSNAQQLLSASLNKPLKDSHFLIKKLIDDGWFCLTSNDHLIISIQSLSELKSYLKERYEISDELYNSPLLECKQCGDIVTIGYKCKSDTCRISFHYKCYNVFRRNKRDLQHCINERCSVVWENDGLMQVGVDPTTLENILK